MGLKGVVQSADKLSRLAAVSVKSAYRIREDEALLRGFGYPAA
jgi:hypothetical protein